MKTKIYVCSNSGIDYIPHPTSIGTIPIILKLSDEEEYEDYSDVTADAFYNRYRMDTNVKVTAVSQNYSKISMYITLAKEEGYGRILFILSAKEFSDLYIPISIAITENEDIECEIYNSNTCCYPLAYMALEANTAFEQGLETEEVFSRLDFLKKNHKIYFFTPKYKDEIHNKNYKAGSILELEKGKLLPVIKEKKTESYDQLFEILGREMNEQDIPFILYTDKTSKYIHHLENSLLRLNSSFKKIKSYSIPPAVGVQVGKYAVGVGYILKNDQSK